MYGHVTRIAILTIATRTDTAQTQLAARPARQQIDPLTENVDRPATYGAVATDANSQSTHRVPTF
jgi:hypothetical protein